jgi:hypothetical protein
MTLKLRLLIGGIAVVVLGGGALILILSKEGEEKPHAIEAPKKETSIAPRKSSQPSKLKEEEPVPPSKLEREFQDAQGAEVNIATIENSSRSAYNQAVVKAHELAQTSNYADAAGLFESVKKGAIPEVAARCDTSIAELRESAATFARYQERQKREAIHKAFREEAAVTILPHLRARLYEAALKEIDGATKNPVYAPLKDALAEERAALADANAFWEAFLQALRSRLNQETSFLLADGRRISGKLTGILPDRIVLEGGDAGMNKLHADLLVGWTIGRTLPAEEAGSYLKAAMFFFCEGRDDLAKLYLATARELKAPAVDAHERVFRAGFLRRP